MALTNKRILVGITGGIAAYKSADLVRRLREDGAEVRVVMTRAAEEFITPLTLQAVSGAPVHRQLFSPDPAAASAMDHIELARWADVVLVAPASADFLARLAHGRSDDLLATICLATTAAVAVAPAMNRQMWTNPATQDNLGMLRDRGVRIFGPAEGSQACGETGPGRMLEPAELVSLTAGLFATGLLERRRVLVTAGPTYEAIDPVRGLTNRSSGRMGYAVAEAARDAGARVVLVTGPTALEPPDRIEVERVTSAAEMLAAVIARIEQTDIFIGVAAVADYRPTAVACEKIKKDADRLTLELVRNPDILASIAARPHPPFTVGFAAETGDLEQLGRAKLQTKGVDLIAANRVDGPDGALGGDLNEIVLIDRQGSTVLSRQPKTRLARQLIERIARSYHEKTKSSAQDTRRTNWK